MTLIQSHKCDVDPTSDHDVRWINVDIGLDLLVGLILLNVLRPLFCALTLAGFVSWIDV